MKKLLQSIYCYTKRKVIDATTGKQEIAIYTKLFGFVIKTTYKTL